MIIFMSAIRLVKISSIDARYDTDTAEHQDENFVKIIGNR